ncbi:MAG: carbohydrate-binding protein, partial [Saprospiraceae bacterium]|nr:carbohydrate-binding protein [Saprospiraceae bacterium]
FLFYYNSDWTAMLGYPAGHGQDNNINDHHFHWGYFIHAAAFLEQFEPGWAEGWGDMINLLVRDAATSDRNDALFPFLRNFSPYAGHCWANGFASFPQGNDQESTSESMQFNSSLIHWGMVTGDDAIRDLGIYLYTTEQSAVEEYWFDIEGRIFPDNQYSVVSRVWGNSYDNGTFFTADIAASYGIELYPIHGGSMYLGHNIAYAENLWTEIEQNTGILGNEVNPNLWHDIMYQYLAFTDPQKAIDLYNTNQDRELKFGVSDAQTYYWLHSMNAIGQIDASITADYPMAVVFQKSGNYTYVAHNYSNEQILVTFSDGYELVVPARSMATNRDVTIDGVLMSSFPSAYPGGSVDLTMSTDNDSTSKVEFYNDGVLVGTVIDPPFFLKAENLTAGVYDFYAKIFEGEDFGVSNIVTVVVGEQEPYSGTPTGIPGVLEAGEYDKFAGGSGQGISYIDVTPENHGDYRLDESVDVAFSSTEGATIGWISGGEWVEYTINVESSGLYEMSLRYASDNQAGGGPFHLELEGQPISEDIHLDYTSGWDDWASKSVSGIALPKGEHILRLAFDNGEFNLARMTFAYQEELPYSQPIADAGENVVVILPASTASLDGSLSSDPGGDTLSFNWVQVYGPSTVVFSDNGISTPDISNLEEGVYKFKLTVSDGTYTSTSYVLVIVSETGNTKPSVNITSPANNSTFREGSAITISASASDLDGEVTLVEFYDGTTKIGEDSTDPYSLVWTDASIGNHQLSAKATDNGGEQATSQIVNVAVQEVRSCVETSADAVEGTFSVGYKATFESVGTNVTVLFELLDTDKVGVQALLRTESPFTEKRMDQLSGNIFSLTLAGQTLGSTIRVACKFEFAGGLAVTKWIDYEVGAD